MFRSTLLLQRSCPSNQPRQVASPCPLYDRISSLIIIAHKTLFQGWVWENSGVLATSNISLPHYLFDGMPETLAMLQHYVRDSFLNLVTCFGDNVHLVDPLTLATSVFRSTRVDQLFSYRQAMHFTYGTAHWSSDKWQEHSWPINRWWAFDYSAYAIIGKIVQRCGLDISRCTDLELETRDPFVMCMTCCQGDLTRCMGMMRWQQAVSHRPPTMRDVSCA